MSNAKYIEISRQNLLRAQRVATDRAVAVAEARRIYKKGRRRGKWAVHQRFARLALARAAREGITIAKPYVIAEDSIAPAGFKYRVIRGLFGGEIVNFKFVPVRL
jgi:hypothetical protein